MVDTFSRFLIVVPTKRARAIDACKAIQEHLLDHYPHPDCISTDRGSHFVSSLNAEFSAINGLQWNYHIAFRPQACSILESRHRELKNCVFISIHSFNLDWPSVIKRVTYIMNASVNRSTKVSPFEIIFGRPAKLSEFDKEFAPPSGKNIPEFMRNRSRVSNLLYKKMSICQNKADDSVRENGPKIAPEALEPGDECFLKREHSQVAHRTKCRWLGPYVVNRSNGYVVQLVDMEGHTDWFHRSQILKKVARSPQLGSIPYFLNLKVPLPKTLPKPPNERKPLNNACPDDIALSPDPQITEKPNSDINCPQASDENSVDPPENPISDVNGPQASDESQIDQPENPGIQNFSDSETSIPAQNDKNTVNVPITVGKKRNLPTDFLVPGEGAKKSNPRRPNPDCTRATTRSRAKNLRSDRALAEEIQNSEVRRSSRNWAIRFPVKNPFQK